MFVVPGHNPLLLDFVLLSLELLVHLVLDFVGVVLVVPFELVHSALVVVLALLDFIFLELNSVVLVFIEPLLIRDVHRACFLRLEVLEGVFVGRVGAKPGRDLEC